MPLKGVFSYVGYATFWDQEYQKVETIYFYGLLYQVSSFTFGLATAADVLLTTTDPWDSIPLSFVEFVAVAYDL